MADQSADSRRERFKGFSEPRYTATPDELFDELLPHLSLAELRIVLYITRRTFGFKKRSDRISLDQLQFGIRKKDGTTLDSGTGLSRNAILSATRSLVDKGIIVRQQQKDPVHGWQSSSYSLNFRKEPLGPESAPRVGEEIAPSLGAISSPYNKQSPTNSSTTPPSNLPQELTEHFYRSLGTRVSPQKQERGVGEIQKLLGSGFSEGDIRYAIDYVVKTYPDTKTIGRLPFLLDEALKKREGERKRETVEDQINCREAKRQAEASKRWEDQRAMFDALPEDRKKELLSRVPRWVEREVSRVAWAIGRMQKEKPEAEDVSSQRFTRGLTAVNPSLDRAVFPNGLERKIKTPHLVGVSPSSAPATTPPLPNDQE